MNVTPANQPPVGAPLAASGGGGGSGGGGTGNGDGNTNPPPADPKAGDTVSYATHRQLLDEKKTVQAELATARAALADRERADAEKAGDFKKLADLDREKIATLERERDELKGKVSHIETQHTQVRKLAAIVKASGGQVDPKWHELIADKFLPDVGLDASGEIDQGSVAKAVEKLRATFPEVIQGRVPGTSNADPSAVSLAAGTIKRSEWRKLPSKEMKKWTGRIVDD